VKIILAISVNLGIIRTYFEAEKNETFKGVTNMPNIHKPFIYVRKDYMNNTIDHKTYYSQLVRPSLVQFIKDTFGMKLLMSKKNDGHFNHIPLKKWDMINGNIHMPKKSDWDMVEDSPTMAGLVCVLKTAARMAVEQEQQ